MVFEREGEQSKAWSLALVLSRFKFNRIFSERTLHRRPTHDISSSGRRRCNGEGRLSERTPAHASMLCIEIPWYSWDSPELLDCIARDMLSEEYLCILGVESTCKPLASFRGELNRVILAVQSLGDNFDGDVGRKKDWRADGCYMCGWYPTIS